MKKLLASTILAVGLTAFAGSASAEECGSITVASMNWQTAEVLAQIDKLMLEAMGCEVEIVPGDTMPTLTAMMEKGEPDVAPEAWINAVREPLDKAVNEGKLVYAGKVFAEGGVEGWWIPKYLADANPDIKTIDDALARPELFPDPEDDSMGAVHNCPSGWNCQISTGNLFKAYGAEEKGFRLVDTGSAAGLDGSIAKAYEGKKGWMGYYWAPTSILGKYEMVLLDHGVPHDKEHWDKCTAVIDCEDPKKNAWAVSEVYTVAVKDLVDRLPVAAEYFKKRSMTNLELGKLTAWMSDNQATGVEGAEYFIQNSENLWSDWVSPEVAAKVKQAAS